jgi:hypothetical protein|tara:strand:+ start:49 stop:333 length:285 start_codon:yes stop_codon:yes gene_type:complete
MERVFEHQGYHLEAYHPISKKYLGYVKIEEGIVPDDAVTGYYSRKLETLNHIATKGSKQFILEGEFITELIPLCGRIIGDSNAVLERSQAWRSK